MLISKYFTLEEMVKSNRADKLGIKNDPLPSHEENLKFLCSTVLDVIRDEFGPVLVTSGYRCYKLNQAVGGSRTTQHCVGLAADFVVPGKVLKEVGAWVEDNIQFDQLIYEDVNDAGEPRWIHISTKQDSPNRKQVLIMKTVNGKKVYSVK